MYQQCWDQKLSCKFKTEHCRNPRKPLIIYVSDLVTFVALNSLSKNSLSISVVVAFVFFITCSIMNETSLWNSHLGNSTITLLSVVLNVVRLGYYYRTAKKLVLYRGGWGIVGELVSRPLHTNKIATAAYIKSRMARSTSKPTWKHFTTGAFLINRR